MSTLSATEVSVLDMFFNNKGYVLDFSNATFADFSLHSIGISVQEKYGYSKAQSLRSFVLEGENLQVRKLLLNLFEYYENLVMLGKYEKKNEELYEKCKTIVNNIGASTALRDQLDDLSKEFGTVYMNDQIDLVRKVIETHPLDAIGKAKELMESCFKTILKNQGVEFDKNWDLPQLSKAACKILKLTPDDIPDGKDTSKIIKKILGSLATITTGVTELRNIHGSGHGKTTDYKGLSPRHARFVVGSAVTSMQFIWETYQEKKERGVLK
jgi:hypothetical protein